MYSYLKASSYNFCAVTVVRVGLFYFPRLSSFIILEANDKLLEVNNALQQQFRIMMKRLWFGITWPSAILTLVFGITVMLNGNGTNFWEKLLEMARN
jgi:putative membrane protein